MERVSFIFLSCRTCHSLVAFVGNLCLRSCADESRWSLASSAWAPSCLTLFGLNCPVGNIRAFCKFHEVAAKARLN
jgi:hypothetical protein